MKRLLKKAVPIYAYHATSSQRFLEIIKDGYIRSNVDSNTNPVNRRMNIHLSFYCLPNEAKDSYEIINLTLNDLLAYSPNPYNEATNTYFSPALLEEFKNMIVEYLKQIEIDGIDQDIYNELINESDSSTFIYNLNYNYRQFKDKYLDNFMNNTEIEVGFNEYTDRNDENKIYLSTKEVDEHYLYTAAFMGALDKSIINFGVALTIEVDTDALSPDMKDAFRKIDFLNGDPLQQSIEAGTVVHNGPIPTENIKTVEFKIDTIRYWNQSFSSKEEAIDFVSQYLSEGKLDFETAVSQLEKLYNNLPKKIESKILNKSRLIKRF